MTHQRHVHLLHQELFEEALEKGYERAPWAAARMGRWSARSGCGRRQTTGGVIRPGDTIDVEMPSTHQTLERL